MAPSEQKWDFHQFPGKQGFHVIVGEWGWVQEPKACE